MSDSEALVYRRISEDARVESMSLNDVTGQIVDAAMRVHTKLGPGLLESAYEGVLKYELVKRGLAVVAQLPLPVIYENVQIDIGYRLDLVVAERVVVEAKAVEAIHDIHRAQLLSYLKLGGYKVGLLLNFHVMHMKEGIVRMVN